jgi:hypothetical protein
MTRMGRWWRRQNPYLWAAGAGGVGLWSAVLPGVPAWSRACGLAAAVGAAALWRWGR